jgi:D-3-phosphoglycerate dehydrogenase
MIKRIKNYTQMLKDNNIDFYCPDFVQTLSEEELIKLLPNYDGWIIGDDPATRRVFESGIKGKLRVAVKWGVGVDNVDFEACKDFDIPITNIPNVFGEEVSDVAIGYLLNLSRQLHNIDKEVKMGNWFKPSGNSLSGKKACLLGFGDIGRSIARKLLAFNINVYASDPSFKKIDGKVLMKENVPNTIVLPEDSCLHNVNITSLGEAAINCDFILVSCALNKFTKGIINKNIITLAKKGVRIINVARGPVVNEADVIELLEEGFIDSVGFDVFEEEPLDMNNKLRKFDKCIFGSHNGSNTVEGVDRTSEIAINKIKEFLDSRKN